MSNMNSMINVSVTIDPRDLAQWYEVFALVTSAGTKVALDLLKGNNLTPEGPPREQPKGQCVRTKKEPLGGSVGNKGEKSEFKTANLYKFLDQHCHCGQCARQFSRTDNAKWQLRASLQLLRNDYNKLVKVVVAAQAFTCVLGDPVDLTSLCEGTRLGVQTLIEEINRNRGSDGYTDQPLVAGNVRVNKANIVAEEKFLKLDHLRTKIGQAKLQANSVITKRNLMSERERLATQIKIDSLETLIHEHQSAIAHANDRYQWEVEEVKNPTRATESDIRRQRSTANNGITDCRAKIDTLRKSLLSPNKTSSTPPTNRMNLTNRDTMRAITSQK